MKPGTSGARRLEQLRGRAELTKTSKAGHTVPHKRMARQKTNISRCDETSDRSMVDRRPEREVILFQ